MAAIQVIFTLRLPARVKKKNRWYVAMCPLLDIGSQGESREIALRNLVEAVSLFLTSCLERATLDEVLKECGLRPAKDWKKFTADQPKLPRGTIPLEIPVPFSIDRKACHA